MKRYFIDYPVYYSLKHYNDTISTIIKKLRTDKNIISIYQIGHITDVGISDIDILVIFKNDYKSLINPLFDSNKIQKYLLVHKLFGMCEQDFYKVQKFSFFHNYKHLCGQKMEIGYDQSISNEETIKYQIALEYLLQFYVSFSVSKKYGIYKVRNILLSVKALMYDLEFLGLKDGELYNSINEILIMRQNWFKNIPTTKEFNTWLNNFDLCFSKFMQTLFINKNMYLPIDANLHPSKHISFFCSKDLNCFHKGLVLPNRLGFLGRKYFNVQNRINKFKIGFPFIKDVVPDVISERFSCIKDIKTYNDKNLPHFMPLASSLVII
jgi:hypothetical protein